MKFAMFFMAEYANMFTVACLASLLFLGGWNGPTFGFAEGTIPAGLLHVFWFAVRIFFFMFLYVCVRGTLPRFRYDQLMGFSWKVLLPLAMANIIVTALVVALRVN
jgi:NADH-quinone oxidoreductase subunit H